MKIQDRIALFIKKEGFEPQAHEICPAWDRCNVNRCPLHENFLKLEIMPDDPEKKCKMAKSIRKEIGEFFKLPNRGLKERELSGLKQWENLSPEQQEIKRTKMREKSLFVRLKKKGYGIMPIKEKQLPETLTNEPKTPKNEVLEADSKIIGGDF